MNQDNWQWQKWAIWYGFALGFLLPPFLIIFYLQTDGMREQAGQALTINIILTIVLLLIWGAIWYSVYKRMKRWMNHTLKQPQEITINSISRRQLLQWLGASGIIGLLVGGRFERFIVGNRQNRMQSLSNTIPDILKVKVFPFTQNTSFPETIYSRYNPQNHPVGVCFSGGGFRSFSASLGQLRGLIQLGLLDKIGAISGASGGALFATLFNYIPTKINDEALLGKTIHPSQLTLSDIITIPSSHITVALLNFHDSDLIPLGVREEARGLRTSEEYVERVYARVLNALLLAHYGLDHEQTFFTLNEQSKQDILAHNPELTPNHFYTMRPDRPYLYVGTTHMFPLNSNEGLSHFEWTPLYSGTPQYFPDLKGSKRVFGGGYVESFGFGSYKMSKPDANNIVTVEKAPLPFLLSDMIAGTSAAPGMPLNLGGQSDFTPEFNYWSPYPDAPIENHEYAFNDGGFLENLGIIPLLRRQYPIIFSFLNTSVPLGIEEDPNAIDGVDHSIGRLFGFMPPDTSFSARPTQIFPQEQFEPLANALKKANNEGQVAMFIDKYKIVQPNFFDIPPYPNDGEVTIVWFHNGLYKPWYDALPDEMKSVMADPSYNLERFPYYKTVAHNTNSKGVPLFFYLTPEQINLMSQMWSYAITDGVGDTLKSLV